MTPREAAVEVIDFTMAITKESTWIGKVFMWLMFPLMFVVIMLIFKKDKKE